MVLMAGRQQACRKPFVCRWLSVPMRDGPDATQASHRRIPSCAMSTAAPLNARSYSNGLMSGADC